MNDRSIQQPSRTWRIIHGTMFSAILGTLGSMMGVRLILDPHVSPLMSYGALVIIAAGLVFMTKSLVKTLLLKQYSSRPYYYMYYIIALVMVARMIEDNRALIGLISIIFLVWLLVGVILGLVLVKQSPQGVSDGSQSSNP